MTSDRFLRLARRDALLAVVGLGLLAAPLWVPALHLDDPTYHYESVAIKTNGSTMAFATKPADPMLGISERIACAGERRGRACVFERYVAANHTVPTGIYASRDHGFRDDVLDHRYRYVLIDGTVYEVGAIPNATVTDHGGHRLDLALRPVAADRALRFVSVDLEDVPAPIRRAARTGRATGHVEALPLTTIEVDNGTYRRVYVADTTYPPDHNEGTESLLRVGGPVVGLALFGWLQTRYDLVVSVTHTDSP